MNGAKLNEHQHFALAAIVQYHLMLAHRKGSRFKRNELGLMAKLDEVDDKKVSKNRGTELNEAERKKKAGSVLTNFLATASPQGALELLNYYKDIVRDERGLFHNPPPHIRAAIDCVYSSNEQRVQLEKKLPPAAVKADVYSPAGVLSHIQYDSPKGELSLLGKNYEGLWDVVRYSAHEFDTKVHGPNPWVVRAALQVGPSDAEKGGTNPWFEIYYKPRDVSDIRESTGSIILINNGTHFCLTGIEHDTNAPIYVIAQFVRTHVNSFVGLVVRRHSMGRVFASRVSFVRSKAKKIDELRSKLDVYPETEFRRKFLKDITDLDKCLAQANSKVLNDGKCVLLL